MIKIISLFIAFGFSLVALSQQPDSTVKKEILYGVASFYSMHFEGVKTATGEIFSQKKLTAASNHFKLNTWLRVTNLSNGKSVIVRVNDRMHPRMAKKGRVVDLTRTGATTLGFLRKGLTRVKVEKVAKGTVD
jgi:rare lipoprotein A